MVFVGLDISFLWCLEGVYGFRGVLRHEQRTGIVVGCCWFKCCLCVSRSLSFLFFWFLGLFGMRQNGVF